LETKLLTFQQFNDRGLAEILTSVLYENNIPYIIEEDSLTFNPSFVLNDELSKVYNVKISPNDFTRATQLLQENEDQSTEEIDKDYYLFQFTNDELMEVLEKADEWSSFDYVLAEKILKERGVIIDAQKISTLNESRIKELKVPEPPQTFWIILGYIFAVMGGLIGIFIGWHLAWHKKTLPDGERVYDYNAKDRKHGRIIFYIGLISFVSSIIARAIFIIG
jgi:hypothetical protein